MSGLGHVAADGALQQAPGDVARPRYGALLELVHLAHVDHHEIGALLQSGLEFGWLDLGDLLLRLSDEILIAQRHARSLGLPRLVPSSIHSTGSHARLSFANHHATLLTPVNTSDSSTGCREQRPEVEMPVLPHHPPCSLRTHSPHSDRRWSRGRGWRRTSGRTTPMGCRPTIPYVLRYWPPAIGPGATADLCG